LFITLEKNLYVIKKIRAGQPGGFKEFGRLQNDTKTDELMMEDLGTYVIKNINTHWVPISQILSLWLPILICINDN
jgi:hypothetical protein